MPISEGSVSWEVRLLGFADADGMGRWNLTDVSCPGRGAQEQIQRSYLREKYV